MKRRDFFKKSVGAGIAAGAAYSLGGYNNLWASPSSPESYDMVAVMGGEPDAMFDKGISALGGITNFVKKGQTVVVKPNIGWDRVPEVAANTNPLLVKRIIEHCIKAGASKVYVLDHTCHNWVKTYKNSGIEKAAKAAGARIVPADTENYYQEITVPGASILKKTKVHELILESDVLINVPILKHHSSTKMTASMKNLMGVVWDRKYWHSNNLHQCIADYATFEKKPALNIIDCYRVMMRNGPQGVSVSDSVKMKAQIISTDMLAADTAAASMLKKSPKQIDYIPLASKMGIGRMDIENLNIHRIKM
ncbi:MAG TPA: tat (twin-arginine translocation) pathway signal sequence [Bacteroidales bacterium]|nr:tat (twin-arginine translocation) pathway signal sequence [Bacteroidales bacterium]